MLTAHPTPSSMKRLLTNGLALSLGAGTYVLAYLIGVMTLADGARIWLIALGRLPPIIAAVVVSGMLLRRLSGKWLQQAWLYFYVTGILWLAGCLIQAVVLLVRGRIAPGVTIGDLFMLAGYPALLVGILYYTPQSLRTYGRLRLALDLFITGLGITTLFGLFLNQFILQGISALPGQIVWGFAFPLADILILVMLLNMLLLSVQGSLRNGISAAIAGMILVFISDTAYAYWSMRGVLILPNIASLGWVAGYTIIASSTILQLRTLPGLSSLWSRRMGNGQNLPVSSGPDIKHRIQQVLPLAVTLGLAWYAILAWRIDQDHTTVIMWLAGLCLLALVLRQGVYAGEVELQEFTLLVNSVAEPAFVCDHHGRIKLANPALEAICSSDDNTLTGKPLTDIFPKVDWRKGRASGGWSGEMDMIDPDGKAIPVYLSLRPVQQISARKVAVAGTAHDLSLHRHQQAALQKAYDEVAAARKQLEGLNTGLEEMVAEKTSSLSDALRRLEEQNQSLQTLDQLKSDFVSLVSHELRAPLTNVAGGIELVLSSPEALLPEVQETLSLVQKEILRLDQFVESILDLSALDAGHVPVYPAPMSLLDYIHRLAGRWYNLGGISHVEFHLPESLPFVAADERALTSVFFHLIDNAQKYAPDCHIIISAWHEQERCYVSVEDDGVGFPTEAISSIFEKFTRLQSADAQTVYGHGLGLYMTRKLLRAMQGDITAENRPGGGARFVFWLPDFQEGYE